MRRYFAFCDPSGGSKDSFTLAIAHAGLLGKAVLDGVWEKKPPFSPDNVVNEFAEVLESYRITTVVGDRYAGEWVRERFREHGVTYSPSEKTKSEIFLEFLALVNSGRVKIPNNKRMRTQLIGLERRTSRSGRDTVDHAPSAQSHDDLANSIAGALVLAVGQRKPREPFCRVFDLFTGPEPGTTWHDPHEGLAPDDPGDDRFYHKI